MGHVFEDHHHAAVAATPDQVWQAIATGPGVDSWFMGRTDLLPGADGSRSTVFGGYTMDSTITGWDPPARFALRTGTATDGRFIAYEFLIEGRGGGSTVLRTVTSGFLPGDDWETEYEAMTLGGTMFFRTLVEYLTHFPDRTAAPVTAFGPPIANWDHAWSLLHKALGLALAVSEGDHVHLGAADLPPIHGTVYYVNPQTLGIRTERALYRFLQGLQGRMIAAHHIFSADPDHRDTEQTWQAWLDLLYA